MILRFPRHPRPGVEEADGRELALSTKLMIERMPILG